MTSDSLFLITVSAGGSMAKNSYSYEKRRRELDKKKKKEAKKQKKMNRPNDEPVAFDEFGLPIVASEDPAQEEDQEEDEKEEEI